MSFNTNNIIGLLFFYCFGIGNAYGEIQSNTPSLKLDKSQLEVKRISTNVGKSNCIDGQCFDKILPAIAYQESSFGKNGKNVKINVHKQKFYYYTYFGDVINIPKNRVYSIQNKKFTFHKILPFITVKREVHEHVLRRSSVVHKQALGTFQIKKSTAKYTIQKMGLDRYNHLLIDDKMLVYKLIYDVHFSADIAVNYLIMNYTHAQRKNHSDPLTYAISKYNGGSNNTIYVNLINGKIKRLYGQTHG